MCNFSGVRGSVKYNYKYELVACCYSQNFKMVVHNQFLINLVAGVHNNIIDGCFCITCREGRVDRYRRYNNVGELFNIFKIRLPHEEDIRLARYHETVQDLITSGKAYHRSCLENTGYVKFKCWANRQPQFANWEPKSLKDFCDQVNEASYVFDHWDIIVRNLTDSRMDCIDARAFSVGMFKEATDIAWCLRHNENLRRKSKKPDEPQYPEDKYNAILQSIVDSGILDDIDRDPHKGTMLGKRLQKDIVRRCRR